LVQIDNESDAIRLAAQFLKKNIIKQL